MTSTTPARPQSIKDGPEITRQRLGTALRESEEPPEDDDWGELTFRIATPDVGGDWTDNGSSRETRQLKHRANGDSRTVPTAPPLTRILRAHLRDFGTGPDGRMFVGIRGGELPTITYRRAW